MVFIDTSNKFILDIHCTRWATSNDTILNTNNLANIQSISIEIAQ